MGARGKPKAGPASLVLGASGYGGLLAALLDEMGAIRFVPRCA